jgi:hypothetical protein
MTNGLSIEVVKPQLLDERLQNNTILRRIDGGDTRYYFTIDGEDVRFYPSWTSVIQSEIPMGHGLLEWYCNMGYAEAKAYSELRAHYGTCLHILCGEFLQNGSFVIDNVAHTISRYTLKNRLDIAVTATWEQDLQKDLIAFAQFCLDKDLKVIAIEVPLISRRAGVAGTIDLVAEITRDKKRIACIIDLKSGRKGFFDSHVLQLHAYKEMWNENFGEFLPISAVFNWSPKDWTVSKAPTYNFVDQSDKAIAGKLPYIVASYKVTARSKPSARAQFTGTLELGKDCSETFKTVDIEEFVLQSFGEMAV